MQLHRDTTVQSLTVTPTLKDGVISFEDSPIVKAVKYGRVLVLDVSVALACLSLIKLASLCISSVILRKRTRLPLRLWLF